MARDCEYCTKFHEKPFSNEDGDSFFCVELVL